jgi:N-acetyl-alpha-D-muramate 1-phosphate uridylyltransferase
VQAVILAGGLATRMHPLTLETPKALIEVAGRPFLAWQLEKIRSSGYARVLLCVGHLGEKIRDYAGDGAGFGLEVDYSFDGPRLLGTAGALRHALAVLEPAFLVTYGDSYLPFDYSAPLRDLEAHPDALGTMSVFKNDDRWDQSNTEVEGERVHRYEKGSNDPALDYIDYGATALRRDVIEALPGVDDERGYPMGLDVLQAKLAAQGRLRAYAARERFYEIGSEAGLSDLAKRLGELS